ncbi:MAG: NAD kinase [Actinobacteria bacterium]|nr:NAD kinase [Actinomycetota bacterium]
MRAALIVAHTDRQQITRMAGAAAEQLIRAGFEVRMLPSDAADCELPAGVRVFDHTRAAQDTEIVLVFGGDGTFLRAAEMARPAGVAMLGVNFGRVGFLAEAEPDALTSTIAAIVERNYDVEERVSIDATIWQGDQQLASAWALNEASLERTSRERMLEVSVQVDDQPLLRFGCDGVLCATPTGSTAYAFSAGGPIVWPTVDALIVVPNAAHALFARPVVVDPDSVIEIELLRGEHAAVLSCDGRRSIAVPPNGRVQVRRGAHPVRIVRLSDWNFTERLVTKFQLPVRGFRDGRPHIGALSAFDHDPNGTDTNGTDPKVTGPSGTDSSGTDPSGSDAVDRGASESVIE